MTKAELQNLVRQKANEYGIDEQIALAQIAQESINFSPKVVYGPTLSPAGAQGIAQFMPATAKRFGLVNPFDPEQALDAWGKYMTFLLNKFGWDRYDLALAGYNAGEGRIQQYGGIPPFKETQNYVRIILANAKKWPANVDSSLPSTPQPQPDANNNKQAPKPKDNSGTIGLLILAILLGLAVTR